MTEPAHPQDACLNLRSKDMFYRSPASVDPEHEALVARLYGTADTRAYWCQCTQTGRGPDDQPVNKTECSKSGRKCHVGLHNLV